MSYRHVHGLLNEIDIVQNPALGACSIWRFGIGYQLVANSPPILPLCFLVLPMVFHAQTRGHITSTMASSGLALLAAKIGRERENLLAIHTRALAMRELSLKSIIISESAGLTELNYDDAYIISRNVEIRRLGLADGVKNILAASEKMGRWFGIVSPNQVASTLAVQF